MAIISADQSPNPHKLVMHCRHSSLSIADNLSKVILDINKNQKIDFLIIEHNMEFIMSISDEIIVMAEGKTLVKGSPKDIQKNQKVLDSYLGYGNDE